MPQAGQPFAHATRPGIVGGGCQSEIAEPRAQLIEQARRFMQCLKRFEWIGPLADMEGFYNQLDLFLLTSRAEGFGMVLAEAMGHGIPCVSTDVGAAQEIVGDAGWVLPVGAPQLLANAILREFRRTETQRLARSAAAMTKFEASFRPSMIRHKYEALLSRLENH